MRRRQRSNLKAFFTVTNTWCLFCAAVCFYHYKCRWLKKSKPYSLHFRSLLYNILYRIKLKSYLFPFWVPCLVCVLTVDSPQIPSIPTGLFVSAKGEGCCLMQVRLPWAGGRVWAGDLWTPSLFATFLSPVCYEEGAMLWIFLKVIL